MSTSANSKRLSAAAERSEGAIVDGRTKNLAFKHKQLRGLFDLLQTHGDDILSALPQSGRYDLELQHALQVVTKAIAKLPAGLVKANVETISLKDVVKSDSRRSSGSGTSVIVANANHPIASWSVPLTTAIADGNPAIVLFSQGSSSVANLLERPFKAKLDQDAFHAITVDPSEVVPWLATKPPGLSGIFSLGHLSSAESESLPIRNFSYNHVPSGLNPVIVDQSILPGNIPLDPKRSGSSPAVQTVAQVLVRSLEIGGQLASASGDKSNRVFSAGAPGYVLVHENLASSLISTLNATLPSYFQAHLQDLSAAGDIISTGSGGLDYLPVFSVNTFDAALDLVLDELPTSHALYIFGEKKFGAYAANNVPNAVVAINSLPDDVIVAGPYSTTENFHLLRSQTLITGTTAQIQKSYAARAWKSLKVKPLAQVPGFRIDFFGGSFLLTAGLFLSCVLGGVGYGLFRGGSLALHKYRGY